MVANIIHHLDVGVEQIQKDKSKSCRSGFLGFVPDHRNKKVTDYTNHRQGGDGRRKLRVRGQNMNVVKRGHATNNAREPAQKPCAGFFKAMVFFLPRPKIVLEQGKNT
ncbi:MAG: hypothetical protein JJ868_03520 [Shimia sp.]|uniref:hypothetical protein n=1 Tax=Shimia sp. TaxID=1954381 RepID=UPI001B0B91E7|nr:hypothetical protein [Shimia sp.]MBO6896422.1 hypothetical protein [Shimia sp.]